MLKRIGLVFILMILCSCFQFVYADPPLPTPVGRVVWIKGALKAVMPNKEERILQKMSVIYLKDVLITDAKSEAQIVFTDNSLVSFYPNTQFAVDQYTYTKKQKSGSVGKYVMNLIAGGFRTITGLIAKNNPNDYEVNTPVATIGVRGTDYAIYIKNNQLFVGYYNGKPCVTGKNKTHTTLCLDEKTKYAKVDGLNEPVPLSQQPDVFLEKLEIIKATIAGFGQSVGSGGGGPITSFCISQ